MALNKLVSCYADELREGIAWVMFWKTGRSWCAEAIWLNFDNDTIEDDDKELAEEVLRQDPHAIIMNGYYCGRLGEDMSIAELTDGVRWHYNNRSGLLKDFLDRS